MAEPTLSIILVSYNTRDLTLRALAHLRDGAAPEGAEVLVVDNASTDGSADAIEAQHPEARLLRSAVNVGFGRAVNLAASQRLGDDLLLVNPDALVRKAGLDRLLDTRVADPGAGLYGGRVSTTSGAVDRTTARRLPKLRSTAVAAFGLTPLLRRLGIDHEVPRAWRSDGVHHVEMLSGALLLITSDAWATTGGFDPIYFVYDEDADLCRRARAAGFTPRLISDPVCVHDSGASSTTTTKQQLLLQARATYLRRAWSGARRTIGLRLLIVHAAVRTAGTAGRRNQPIDWRSIWASRRTWIQGFPPAP